MQTGKTHTVYAHPSWTVGNLMWTIEKMEGIPIGFQRLLFNRKLLVGQDTLEQHKIGSQSTLHLFLQIRGD
ncbi:hypothetical protein CHLNCDRAFT_27202 [Chlorella variabilis]|uniref:Ubiquitin-like domain-containing protein n=1 Tax=Chlorella variabilis TaxID=554065 RepID=E1ZPS3_CHLVA|nr:hypothetical protein CHLNCDRAFT_27202 [Chlorella variabilis]EFN52197.1 hypothetical protein CHLNCDRAFT_27202 [Chlorella variabilis]|eukprot:XP_005844299.1 hypothetical protein CHLNCDRAFT_27202 [Chlorella variabilis]